MTSANPHTPQDKTTDAPRSPLGVAINILVGLVVSAVFIVLVVRDVSFEELQDNLDQLTLWPIVAYSAILSAGHGLRIWRWGLTVREMAQVRWGRIATIGAVGMMAIFALPARLGEVVRPALVARESEATFGAVGATVVVERLADGICMSAVLFLTLLFLDSASVPPLYLTSGYIAAAVFLGGGLGVLVAALTYARIAPTLRANLSRVSEKLASKVDATLASFFEGLRLLTRPRVALLYVGQTIFIWALTGCGLAVLFWAFPAPVGQLGLVAAFATLSTTVVGVAIPSGPGTVGVFHWAVAFGLSIFAVGQAQGLLVGTVLHLVVAACNIGFGLLAWILGGISLKGVVRLGGPDPQSDDERRSA